jgi:hypothetical protein
MTQTQGGVSMSLERLNLHSTANVEVSELGEVIADVIREGAEKITMLLGLMHRLDSLNRLQYALVHDSDDDVRARIAEVHQGRTLEFKGANFKTEIKGGAL